MASVEETMREQIERLRKLQTVDDGVRSCEEQIAKLQEQVRKLDREFAGLQASLSTQTADSKSSTVTLKVKETELAAVETQIERLQVQLNSKIKSNKEFTAIKHEIGTFRGKASKLEDEVLMLMERLEGGGEAIQKLRADVEAREGQVQAEKEGIEGRIAAIQEHLASLQTERAEVVKGVDAESLAVYERVHRGIFGGKAVVAAKNFVCSGCNMTIPPNVVNMLMRSENLIICRSCQRILYLDQEEG